MQTSFPTLRLFLIHVFIIVLSNYAVQIPVTVLGVDTTWGTFTYPFIFVATDLTIRIYGSTKARKIIFTAMLPALFISYIVGTIFSFGQYQGVNALLVFSLFVFRISLASFSAYVIGQIADIVVFQRLRQLKQWYIAPAASSIVGNALDTFIFYAIAFYQCDDPYMAANWVSLGIVDYLVKVAASLSLFVPVYGIILNFLAKYVFKRPLNIIA